MAKVVLLGKLEQQLARLCGVMPPAEVFVYAVAYVAAYIQPLRMPYAQIAHAYRHAVHKAYIEFICRHELLFGYCVRHAAHAQHYLAVA